MRSGDGCVKRAHSAGTSAPTIEALGHRCLPCRSQKDPHRRPAIGDSAAARNGDHPSCRHFPSKTVRFLRSSRNRKTVHKSCYLVRRCPLGAGRSFRPFLLEGWSIDDQTIADDAASGWGYWWWGSTNPLTHAPFNFNFNSLAPGDDATDVTTYMNGLLGAGSVVVTLNGNVNNNSHIVTNSYIGDGHVVGPVGPNGVSRSPSAPPMAVAACYMADPTTTSSTPTEGTFIQMVFTGVTISQVSFDYQNLSR